MDAEPDSPASELVHHNQNPISSQRGGFTTEQITAPQAVLGVAEKVKAGRTLRAGIWGVVVARNSSNDILVDFNAKGQGDLLGDARTAPIGIAPFHLNDSLDEFPLRSLWPRSTSDHWREEGMRAFQRNSKA